ncbi:MAG: hypothetical protein SFT93_05025, partial [Rickettsiaceae bacterium]|nr:hypothetical protein [Rickettsiaceae bacterium]
LSAVYTNNNYKHYTANGIIRRIWTDKLRFHDYNIKDKSLYICHFPSEKKHGFKSLWSILFIQNKPWPSTNDIFKIMNCHHSFSDISKIIIRLAHRTKLKIYEYIQ